MCTIFITHVRSCVIDATPTLVGLETLKLVLTEGVQGVWIPPEKSQSYRVS